MCGIGPPYLYWKNIAIRNRYSIPKHHRVLGFLKYPENSEPIASDTETVADTSDVPGSELLADLPFYE